ncbi:MAG TPA: hypothetical protein DCE41_37310 [Cytophagales bacterium]|nr:hypothetical protein [Cytophagales bacterium]HAA21923.1 hypothetical protein [Cytophagales bacterium]HAP63820.1 hypothetical protein [Cytophagales bacterium]
MKKLVLVLMVAFMAVACEPAGGGAEEAPAHLVLGNRLKFLGSSPETTYLIVGYRGNYEGKVEKRWKNQEYITFIYINDLNEVGTGTVHVNSVVKD